MQAEKCKAGQIPRPFTPLCPLQGSAGRAAYLKRHADSEVSHADCFPGSCLQDGKKDAVHRGGHGRKARVSHTLLTPTVGGKRARLVREPRGVRQLPR